MAHPKFNRCHMIYVKRSCEAAREYIKQAGYPVIYAKIPVRLRANIRMAQAMGLEFFEHLEGCEMKDGVLMDMDIYKGVL